MTPKEAAYQRLAEHCSGCRTCTAVDDQGHNKNLPCRVANRLYAGYRRARRGAAAPAREGSTA